jgi:hypothetical protein
MLGVSISSVSVTSVAEVNSLPKRQTAPRGNFFELASNSDLCLHRHFCNRRGAQPVDARLGRSRGEPVHDPALVGLTAGILLILDIVRGRWLYAKSIAALVLLTALASH